MAINFNVTGHNNITSSIKRVQQKLKQIPKEAHREFVKNTPVRTGNARRKTVLRGSTIEARYPYAQPLDEGHSNQSPRGMSTPTEEFIQKRIKTILKAK